MKKILPILILSAAAVFLLSSCDQMLEALFPAETGHGGTANNTITFYVNGYDQENLDLGHATGLWAYSPYGPGYQSTVTTLASHVVYVNLYQYTGGGLTVYKTIPVGLTFQGNGLRTAYVPFTSVPDGSYAFDVYYDLDNTQNIGLAKEYSGNYYTAQGTVNSSPNYTSVYVSGGATDTVTVSLTEYPY